MDDYIFVDKCNELRKKRMLHKQKLVFTAVYHNTTNCVSSILSQHHHQCCQTFITFNFPPSPYDNVTVNISAVSHIM